MQRLTFIPANLGDSNDLYTWRNDKLTRQMSRNINTISLTEHEEWYKKALFDSQIKILVFYLKKQKIGVVRFNYQGKNSAEVNINLNPLFRRRGFGQAILEEACQHGFAELGFNRIYAEVKKINIPSIKIFERAGFMYLPHENMEMFRMELLKPIT